MVEIDTQKQHDKALFFIMLYQLIDPRQSLQAQRSNPSCLAFCLLLALMAPTLAFAQSATGNGGLVIPGASDPAQPPSQTCVQVKVNGEAPSAYNCLNQQLQQEVLGTSTANPKLPLSASSGPNQVGTFNEQSLREQYGQNFGKSAIPYRPPPPNFNTSLSP
jgi:hypothetical protein